MSIEKIALYYVNEAYTTGGPRLMGRNSAGEGFLRALVAARPGQIWCYCPDVKAAGALRQEVDALGGKGLRIEMTQFLYPQRLADAGLLYRPDPGIGTDAWRRLRLAHPRAYSLCGVTHTTASETVMGVLARLVTDPLEDWDAVICTSRAVRDSVRTLAEQASEYLRDRVGATRFRLPQLPMIPLGVHCDDFVFSDKERADARTAMNLSPEQTVFLFVGRLSFHAKAHYLPMYLGLEAAAAEGPVTLVQAGWFANEATERVFREEAKKLCPSVNIQFVDGRDPTARRRAWAAADVFTSMSDNIQETYGLTPVEAMASGLPVVVTDWDGYRDTVRDGVDGFRIPTLSVPPGTGGDLVDAFELGMLNYDRYCGSASQLVAVDVVHASERYRLLTRNRELRRTMGKAGQQRARSEFDWSVIMNRYADLWSELGERRRAGATLNPPTAPRQRPDRPDPFTMFATYPSLIMSGDIRIRRIDGIGVQTALERRELDSVKFAVTVPHADMVQNVYDVVPADRWMTVGEIHRAIPALAENALIRTLVWLGKVGIFRFAGPPEAPDIGRTDVKPGAAGGKRRRDLPG